MLYCKFIKIDNFIKIIIILKNKTKQNAQKNFKNNKN